MSAIQTIADFGARAPWAPGASPDRPPFAGRLTRPGVVLVPVGLSEPIGPTLAPATELALHQGGTVILLHSVRLNIAGEEFGIPRARLLEELAREAEGRLREALRGGRWGTPAEILVCEGSPGPAIVEWAGLLRPFAIVMRGGSQGRWFEWLGSGTPAYVARRAACPVWVLPGPPPAALRFIPRRAPVRLAA